MAKTLDKIIKFSLYSLIFLLPLFWLPFSFEAYEFNKQYLLFFLVSIAFSAWLAKMVFVEKEIRFRRTPLDIPVLLFLLTAIISAIFSVDKNSSLFGFYGRFSNGLIGLLCLGVFYFLITSNTIFRGEQREKDDGEKKQTISHPLFTVPSLTRVFFSSTFLVVLISYLSIFGAWSKLNNLLGQKLPLLMLPRIFNPVSGSLEGLTMFLSIVVVLITSFYLKSQLKKVGMLVLLFLSLGLLIIVDFSPAWITLIVSFSLFLIFALKTRIFKENINPLLLPIFLIGISVIFLVSNPLRDTQTELTQFALPQEQVLEQGISWKVAFGTMGESLKSGLLGSGIGTFHYDFLKQKPAEFNETPLWQIRFDRAGSHIAEILGTIGVLGIISYLALIGVLFLVFWFLRQKLESFPYVMTFLAIFIGQFVYYQNTILIFTFWFILALSVASWRTTEKTFSLKRFPELSLIFSAFLVLFYLLIGGAYYFGAKFYLAEVNYTKSQIMLPAEGGVKLLEKAINLNPKLTHYQIALARTYLFQFAEEMKKPLEEQNSMKIQSLTAKAVDQAKSATEISPNSVVAWETSGVVYRDIQFLTTGATEWAIKAFEEAIKLERKSPVLYTELGKLYLVLNNFEKAEENFVKAKDSKPDYVDALIQEALIYEKKNNLDEALSKIEELAISYPLDAKLRFQLGRLYFNKGKIEEAIFQFERALIIMPNYSDALYSLGIAYAKGGEKDKAIAALERVLELNPGNQDVIQKLEELE